MASSKSRQCFWKKGLHCILNKNFNMAITTRQDNSHTLNTSPLSHTMFAQRNRIIGVVILAMVLVILTFTCSFVHPNQSRAWTGPTCILLLWRNCLGDRWQLDSSECLLQSPSAHCQLQLQPEHKKPEKYSDGGEQSGKCCPDFKARRHYRGGNRRTSFCLRLFIDTYDG